MDVGRRPSLPSTCQWGADVWMVLKHSRPALGDFFTCFGVGDMGAAELGDIVLKDRGGVGGEVEDLLRASGGDESGGPDGGGTTPPS